MLYLAITFAISWSVASIAWLGGARTIGDAPLANQLFTWGPPIAALICAFLFHKGKRIAVLGLRFRPNRWWLAAFLIPFAIQAYHFAVTQAFPQVRTEVLTDMRVNAAVLLNKPVAEMPAGLGGVAFIFLGFALVFSLLFTLTEELGWRGYLYRQWRHLGFWRFSLIQGIIWGVWHWPMVIYFGMVFADDRWAGLVYYPLSLMTLAPIMTLMRDRDGSIWAPGILHGTLNAISIVAFGALTHKTEPNFAAIAVNASMLVFVELFRRTWPENAAGTSDPAIPAVL
jgi:membrane protease YdiL (CAAX protease family)